MKPMKNDWVQRRRTDGTVEDDDAHRRFHTQKKMKKKQSNGEQHRVVGLFRYCFLYFLFFFFICFAFFIFLLVVARYASVVVDDGHGPIGGERTSETRRNERWGHANVSLVARAAAECTRHAFA